MPKPFDQELERLEERLVATMATPKFKDTVAEYNRLLNLLGNVDGDEIIALILIAADTTPAL